MDTVKLALVVFFVCGCTITSIEKVSSSTEGVPAGDIAITVVSVSSDGALADANITILVNDLPAVLGGGDVLRLADGHGATASFTGDPGVFEAKLPTSDTALSIELVRNGAVATTISVPLPPPFAPAAISTSRASGITLSWAAAPSFKMAVVATGAPCLPDGGFTAHLEPDTGAFQIQPADMITVAGACEITVAFTRGAQQIQARTLTVPTTP